MFSIITQIFWTAHYLVLFHLYEYLNVYTHACIHVRMLSHFSHVQLFETLWTVAHQGPLSMGFSRQEYWSGLPCPAPGDLPDPGIEPMSLTSPVFADRVFTTNTTGEAQITCPFPNAPGPFPSGCQSPGTRKWYLYLSPPLTAVKLTFSYEWRWPTATAFVVFWDAITRGKQALLSQRMMAVGAEITKWSRALSPPCRLSKETHGPEPQACSLLL